jgi:hypothetical protein
MCKQRFSKYEYSSKEAFIIVICKTYEGTNELNLKQYRSLLAMTAADRLINFGMHVNICSGIVEGF